MLNFEKKIIIITILIFAFQLLFPQYSFAYASNNNSAVKGSMLAIANSPQAIMFSAGDYQEQNYLPLAGWRQPRRKMKITVTAYSSTVDQCDSTPFITANGAHVKDGIVAANFLPFGAKVKIPGIYGDKTFSVEDRMNSRYYYHLDIWMPSREAAKQFGVQYAEVEIY